MATFDWSKFSQKVYINAPIQKVYNLWGTRSGLENWFLRKAEFTTPNGTLRTNDEPIQAGDNYEWLWHGYPDTLSEHGTVTEANDRDRFSFIFGKAGVVTIQLQSVDDLTEMILTQDQIPTDDESKANYHVGCSTGWTFYLANIKSILEGGLDLRNKNPKYTNVINA